jgi:hypothetical protein
MKKVITLAVLALSLTSCGVVPMFSPGVTTNMMAQGVKACEGQGGLDLVNTTVTGFTAYCNNDSKIDI